MCCEASLLLIKRNRTTQNFVVRMISSKYFNYRNAKYCNERTQVSCCVIPYVFVVNDEQFCSKNSGITMNM